MTNQFIEWAATVFNDETDKKQNPILGAPVVEMEILQTEFPPVLAKNMVPVRGLTVIPHSLMLNPVAQLGLTTAHKRRKKEQGKEINMNREICGY